MRSWSVDCPFFFGKDLTMGDKGGKKDKHKNQKQKAAQQKQEMKGKQEKTQPKTK